MTFVQTWRNAVTRQLYHLLPTLLRVGVIVGLFGAALISGILLTSGRIDPELLLAASVGAIGAVIAYRVSSFQRSILAIALAGGVLNFVYIVPPGSQSQLVVSLVLSMAVVGFWLLGFVVRRDQEPIKPSPINWPLWLFVIVNAVSYIWGTLLRDPLVYIYDGFIVAQAASFVVNILLPLLALLVANHMVELKWLRTLAWIMVGLGTLNVVSTEFNLPTQQLIHNGARGLFSAWVGAIAYALAIYDEKQPLWRRGLLLVLLVVILYQNMIMNTLWLSGWIPLMAALVVITFYRSKKLFALGVVVALIVMAANFDIIYQEVVVGNVDEGGLGRLEIWSMNLGHVVKHPFFGMGPAGYAVYNMTYHPLDARSTHNNYFDVLAQTGVIGFGIFIWLLFTFGKLAHRNMRRVAARRDFTESLAVATLGGVFSVIVGMMLGDWVLPFAYNQTISGFDNAAYSWIFLGAIAALAHVIDKMPPSAPEVVQETSTAKDRTPYA